MNAALLVFLVLMTSVSVVTIALIAFLVAAQAMKTVSQFVVGLMSSGFPRSKSD